MSEKNEKIIQYVPFHSFVNPSFWHALTEIKLNVDKLNENTKQIFGRYTYRNDIGPVFEIDGTSFNKTPDYKHTYLNVTGTIMNKNTVEDFKSLDKAALLNSVGEIIATGLINKSWIESPINLLNFFILSFADLKKFHYYYWFAFPTPNEPTVYLKQRSDLTASFTQNQLEIIAHQHKELHETQKCFFMIKKQEEHVKVLKIADIEYVLNDLDDVYFAFADPSNTENPGWPLRIFIAALLENYEQLCQSDIRVVGVRCDRNGSITNSILYVIQTTQKPQAVRKSAWVGWERNSKGNFGPKLANMSASMDPVRLADASSDLNIRLMKWRLVPDLNVDVMKDTKCLLMGAGTLGCHVARNLLAWGFRHLTFIDNGKVSFSNPTRQVLFNYEDCLNGGQMKASAAAQNLRKILPTVEATGLPMHIPMPGHPIGDSLKDETIRNIELIVKSIEEHDVIFLLLDTREARWLPTLLAAHYGKIVINAALGFDSYLVMRHGVGLASTAGTHINSTHVPGSQLGCYFCNDVTVPGNSLRDRTLDQQCTVTRPGVAAIAGALAVEILVGLLQHPLRIDAPAAYNQSDDDTLNGVLGIVPHTIRGFLHSYQNVTPTCTKFQQCIACSDIVIQKYREEGIQFLFKVFNSGTYLEEITGLSELQLSAEMSEILTFSDEDQE
ncbi:ubiquitin-like modifier-activating enzyme ATG7 isoform X1 [Leptidea sinapis]|uniref:ubiquitin-like modifier-activating enzyme ATG7 isoform X1 n=2 Tax=Leptidea sinapis TaxID=189913 RepID=UPI00213C091E|nr:ubiquitin-like modifier-activating enzyme ATG7 isoform X1 [Leptidea sinapis]